MVHIFKTDKNFRIGKNWYSFKKGNEPTEEVKTEAEKRGFLEFIEKASSSEPKNAEVKPKKKEKSFAKKAADIVEDLLDDGLLNNSNKGD